MSGVVNRSAAARERKRGKKLKPSPVVSTQPFLGKERKSYCVEMEEGEYESLEVFKSHTCDPGCGNYFVCDVRVRAVELHFKKFIESVFGRESAKMVQGLDVIINLDTCVDHIENGVDLHHF